MRSAPPPAHPSAGMRGSSVPPAGASGSAAGGQAGCVCARRSASAGEVPVEVLSCRTTQARLRD